METIADFGTVAYFGVQTFATGIYTSWFSLADRAGAAQLALCLLSFALFLAVLGAHATGRQNTTIRRGASQDKTVIGLKGLVGLGALTPA